MAKLHKDTNVYSDIAEGGHSWLDMSRVNLVLLSKKNHLLDLLDPSLLFELMIWLKKE